MRVLGRHWLSCCHRDLYDLYHYLYLLTGVLFYVSSAVNPVLYNLLSAAYRRSFLAQLGVACTPRRRARQRPRRRLAGRSVSISSSHTLCTAVVKETACV